METIYDPKSFKSSEHMALADYFKSYREICPFAEIFPRDNLSLKNDEEYLNLIRQEMGLDITNEDLHMLEETCSVNALTLSDEPNNMPMEIPQKLRTKTKLEHMYPTNNSARQLHVVVCLGVLDKKHNVSVDFKFGSKRFLKTATVSSNKSIFYDMMPGSNFIYTIIIYRPFAISFSQRNSADKLRMAFEIEALGTNTLAQVADTIRCIFKEGLFREVENTKQDLGPLMHASTHYPSQCIYIDEVVYNDFRSPECIDYSTKIIQWASEKGIGKFKTELMENTTLNTLSPRLGYPYVYIHQGNCEHVFTFSDARLLQPGDCLDSRKYPRITSMNRESNIICFICSAMNAQWIVVGCEKLPHEKVFLCTDCCDSYLFVDGKKVTDFKLYPYYDQDMLTRHLGAVIVE